MSYNILKSKVNFVGDDTPEIEGMVDTSSDQTINGQKTFTDLSASSISVASVVSHTGDSDTRISFQTDRIQFFGEDVELFTIYGNLSPDRVQVQTGNLTLPNGNIGIGVSVPTFELEVDGDISGSGTFHNVGSASFGNDLSVTGTIYGDGSGITGVTTDSILAANLIGQISGSQISASTSLTTDGNNLAVDLKSQGALADDSGLKVDIGNSPNQGSFNNSHYILVSGSTIKNRNLQLSVLESGLDLAATQISSGKLDNDRMPNNISVSQLSASTTISGAYFEGDGSGLTGVTGNPTPGGANTEIQFNDDDSLTGSPDLTFFTGSQTLATTNISASSNISGSSLYLQEEIIVGGQTFLDIQGDVVGNNASFVEITASSTIHGYGDIYAENFRGNGNTLNNVPLGTYANSNIVFCDNTADTITSNGSLRWTGTQLVTLGVSASVNISGSGLYFDDSLNLGGQPVINANGDTNFGQLTFFVASSGSTNFPTDNSRATFYVDEAANKFFVFVKYSDGTEKSGSIDLE
jgi:hypothetical protein